MTTIAIRKTPRHVRSVPVQTKIAKLSILVPCYNEESTIARLLDRVCDADLVHSIEKEIIVINDCSKDETDLILREYLEDNPQAPIVYIRHETNMGKGAAIQSGLKKATGDHVIIQDADLEYDPNEYRLLLEPIINGHADIVYGSRFSGGNPHRILFFWHTLGNKILTLISNIFTNMNLSDAHTCYKVLPTSLLLNIPLLEKRFAFDAELNAKLSSIPNLRIYEVGISYYGRTFADGKKIRLKDAVRSIYSLIKYSMFYKNRQKAELEVTAR